MKRKSWLFAIYAIVIVTTVVVALVFWPEKDKSKVPSYDDSSYATSLTLNLPSKINLMLNTTAELKSGFLQIFPAKASNKLNISITPKLNSSAQGLKFENNILSAKEVGTYLLNFEVPKSSSQTIKRTTEVVIHNEETLAHIAQSKTSLIKGRKTALSDLFQINSTKTFNVVGNNKLEYVDNSIIAKSIGESALEIEFIDGFIKYLYKFSFYVKEVPIFNIGLNNVVDNKIEININDLDSFHISYTIFNGDEEYVDQSVGVVSEEETILSIEKVTPPLIKIKALKVGSVKLTIICLSDTSVKLEIMVTIV